ncbi:sulfite exporter TauE/SafE family protein [Microlunatus sp. GCM10028923]|uniref:sulfite exporter TauE/SafE family protein n=1 Tax=Microlunatus sp. GCM10028923 TaxID=3273400 RepID=UPI00361C173E
MDPVVVVAIVLLASAVIQACTGFGYAIVSAPILAWLLGPAEAVSLIMISGLLVDVGLFALGGRRPAPAWAEVFRLFLWSLPGLALGAIALAVLPAPYLKFAMIMIILAVVLQRLIGGRFRSRLSHGPAAAIAGLSSGLLNTSTTLAGPPLAVYLAHRIPDRWQQRDTLITLSLLRLPVSVATMIIAGSWRPPEGLPLCLPAAAAGFLLGRYAFSKMSEKAHRRAVTTALLLALTTAAAALVPLLIALST